MALSRRIEKLLQELGEDSQLNVSGQQGGQTLDDTESQSDMSDVPGGVGAGLGLHLGLDDSSSFLPGSDDPVLAFTKLERIYTDKLQEREAELVRHKAAAGERELQLHEELRRRESELAKIKSVMEGEVKALLERQSAIEASAPALHAQLDTARRQLADLRISDAVYDELMRVPEDKRPLADTVRVRVHETLRELRTENERLRHQTTTAVETAHRCSEDAEKLRRDNERVAAQCAARERDAADLVESQRCRTERLERELEEALVRAEVLTAKGALYDELKNRCDAFESEALRARAQDEALAVLRAELESRARTIKERDAAVATLLLDKAHLMKQGELLEQQVARLSSDLESRDARIGDLKRQRQGLYDKLLEEEKGAKERTEAKIMQEIERLKRESSSELSRIREDSRDQAQREALSLREMRDAALMEQERLRGQLRDAEAAHDHLLAELRDLQRRSDVRITELQAAVGIKGLELDHVRAALDERTSQARALEAEASMLRDKSRIIGESFHSLENEKNRRVAELEERLAATREQLEHYELIESNIDEAIINSGRALEGEGLVLDLGGGDMGQEGDTGPGTVIKALEGAVPMAVRRRVKQALVLAGRCARLEAEREALVRQKEEAEARARSSAVELVVVRQKLALVPQPQGTLLQAIEAAEGRAREAEAKCAEVLSMLRQSEEQVRLLRDDLGSLLGERRALDEMRKALALGQEWEGAEEFMAGSAARVASDRVGRAAQTSRAALGGASRLQNVQPFPGAAAAGEAAAGRPGANAGPGGPSARGFGAGGTAAGPRPGPRFGPGPAAAGGNRTVSGRALGTAGAAPSARSGTRAGIGAGAAPTSPSAARATNEMGAPAGAGGFFVTIEGRGR